MILNTGARTDTVQYYSEWLLNRFKEGFVYSRNPLYPNKVTKYELVPDKIDAVVFCSKNYKPILHKINEISDKFNTYFYYTITAYGKDIEPGVPTIEESIETLFKLENIVGTKRIAWRYDPVLLTSKYTVDYHLKTFEYITKQLSGHVDRCIFSFVEMYKKLKVNMPEILLLNERDKNIIAKNMGKIASKYSMIIQTCGTDDIYEQYGINQSGCMTLDILGNANNLQFKKLKHRGLRKGCHCIETRDIGAYDTCLNGCKYCYANSNPDIAKENYKLHDKKSPLIIGNIKDTDIVYCGNQKSFLQN